MKYNNYRGLLRERQELFGQPPCPNSQARLDALKEQVEEIEASNKLFCRAMVRRYIDVIGASDLYYTLLLLIIRNVPVFKSQVLLGRIIETSLLCSGFMLTFLQIKM